MSATRGSARRRRPAAADGGFTLSELLVVMVLLGIIGAVVGTVVQVGLSHQTQLQARNASFADARKVIQRVDRDIRSAWLGAGTNSTTLVLDEYTNGLTSPATVVTYTVSATSATRSQLSRQACATCTAKVLISDLVQTSTSPVFSFKSTYSYGSSQPSSDVNVVSASNCSYVASPSQIKPSCVGVITVHLMVQPSTINQPIDIGDGGTQLRNTA